MVLVKKFDDDHENNGQEESSVREDSVFHGCERTYVATLDLEEK